MDNSSRFGVFLPTYIWPDDGPERARNIKTFARRVEELGFDSLFVTDHLLTARRFYSASFLDSLTTLAVAAGVTERVRLGTSVLKRSCESWPPSSPPGSRADRPPP